MGTFTTQQATDYLRECLARAKNPTPFVIIEQAHRTQRMAEIMTRLQGHFGPHDHQPSLEVIARDAVCNLYLEHVRAGHRENLKGWIRRGREAAARYDAKRYDYCEAQPENDGVSLAATDDEVNTLMAEHRFTSDDVDQIEAELDAEDAAKKAKKPRGSRRARVEPEPAKLVEVAGDPVIGYMRHVTAVVSFRAVCIGCGYKIRSTSTNFARELQDAGWEASEAGLLCIECAPKPVVMWIKVAGVKVGDILHGSRVIEVAEWIDDGGKTRAKGRKITCEAGGAFWYYDHNEIEVMRVLPPLAIVTCQKCGKETTGPLIAVDAEDFDVRFFNGDEWIADPNKKVARLICAGCCRG